jgi:hypothetical protein
MCRLDCSATSSSLSYTLEVIELLVEEELHETKRTCSSSVGGGSWTTRAVAILSLELYASALLEPILLAKPEPPEGPGAHHGSRWRCGRSCPGEGALLHG